MRTTSSISTLLAMAALGCGGPDTPSEPSDRTAPSDPVPATTPSSSGATDATVTLTPLEPVDQLVRVSMALRGVRPSVDEMERVRADPTALEALVDDYLASESFLGKIRDLHAETYLLGDDLEIQIPNIGELAGQSTLDVYESQLMEPLKLVEHVVANDLPYTEIVTADYMFADEIVARIYGVDHDPEGPEWQMSQWADGRPLAGVLSSGKMWRRWTSNGSNFQRARANMVADKFLCSGFDGRDVLVLGGVDVSDEHAVSEAVLTVPECVSCHQTLDPLAGYFWGFMDILDSAAITVAHGDDCRAFDYTDGAEPMHGHNQTSEFMCYPVRQYSAFAENDWEQWGLREPGYFGEPAASLEQVGELIAADPRFAQCTARRFFGFFDQVDPSDVPIEVAVELQAGFVGSGFNARQLARDAVLRPEFLSLATSEVQTEVDTVVGLKIVRPEEYASAVEALTGYRWLGIGDADDCNTDKLRETRCWGAVDLNRSDVYGFRAMAGGIDSMFVTVPLRSATAVKLIAQGMYAADAAAFVVEHDLGAPVDERRLLTTASADATDEATVRAQLAELQAVILAQFVAPDDALLDPAYDLWVAAAAQPGATPADAWVVTLSAMLQDPRFLYY